MSESGISAHHLRLRDDLTSAIRQARRPSKPHATAPIATGGYANDSWDRAAIGWWGREP